MRDIELSHLLGIKWLKLLLCFGHQNRDPSRHFDVEGPGSCLEWCQTQHSVGIRQTAMFIPKPSPQWCLMRDWYLVSLLTTSGGFLLNSASTFQGRHVQEAVNCPLPKLPLHNICTLLRQQMALTVIQRRFFFPHWQLSDGYGRRCEASIHLHRVKMSDLSLEDSILTQEHRRHRCLGGVKHGWKICGCWCLWPNWEQQTTFDRLRSLCGGGGGQGDLLEQKSSTSSGLRLTFNPSMHLGDQFLTFL